MGRTILGVVIGYVVVFVWVFATSSLAWMALGPGFAFEGDTPHTSVGWGVLSLVLGVVGAAIAGWIAAFVGRGARAANWLAVVILVLGLATAVYYLTIDREAMALETLAGRSSAEVPMMEAASVAVAPAWYNFGIAVVGAAGAVLGGRLRGSRAPA